MLSGFSRENSGEIGVGELMLIVLFGVVSDLAVMFCCIFTVCQNIQ